MFEIINFLGRSCSHRGNTLWERQTKSRLRKASSRTEGIPGCFKYVVEKGARSQKGICIFIRYIYLLILVYICTNTGLSPHTPYLAKYFASYCFKMVFYVTFIHTCFHICSSVTFVDWKNLVIVATFVDGKAGPLTVIVAGAAKPFYWGATRGRKFQKKSRRKKFCPNFWSTRFTVTWRQNDVKCICLAKSFRG